MSFRRVTLADLAAPIRNAIVGGPFGSNLVSRDYVDTGVPVIRGQNMGGRWVTGPFAFVTAEKAVSLSQNLARPGDLVFTQRGTLGQVALVPGRPFADYLVSQSQMKITVDPSKTDAKFLYYLFRTPKQQQYIFNSAIQTGVPHTNLGILKATPVDLPSLTTQKEIAAICGALDDRIEVLHKTSATLEAIAQALFKSWFVDFDPVRAKSQGQPPAGMDEATAALFPDGLEESALGRLPTGWIVGALGDVAKSVKAQLKPADLHADINYVGLEHMPRKSLSLASWDSADGLESAKAQFSDGDVLFGKLRPYFHKVVIAPFDGVCSTDVLVCQSKQRDYYGFVAMQLFSEKLVDYADRLSNGAKMPRIGWSDLAAYPVAIPSPAVANAYTEAITPLLDRMKSNVFQAQTLATLRDTLLPRLTSGQLRVPEAEQAIEESTA